MGPPNGPSFARCGSVWIYWGAPVASAKVFTRSCVISSQSVRPRSRPASAVRPSRPWAVVVMGRCLSGGGLGRVGLAHGRFDDLSGGRAGQPGGEDDGLGDLVLGEPAVQVREDLPPVVLAPGLPR